MLNFEGMLGWKRRLCS